jgi:competence protein ComEA
MLPDPPNSSGPATTPPAASPIAAPLQTAWPRSAQVVTAFLLGALTTLVAVRCCSSLSWFAQPTHLEPMLDLGFRIDLNRADRADLLQLPGVGEHLAQRIEDHRAEHGAFHTLEDLRGVRGVGATTLERLRPWVRADATEPSLKPTASKPAKADSAKSPNAKEVAITSPIDLNNASAAELQRLPGIGPKRAQQIIAERPFRTVDELRRVHGIGAKTLEKLRPYITVKKVDSRVASSADQ